MKELHRKDAFIDFFCDKLHGLPSGAEEAPFSPFDAKTTTLCILPDDDSDEDCPETDMISPAGTLHNFEIFREVSRKSVNAVIKMIENGKIGTIQNITFTKMKDLKRLIKNRRGVTMGDVATHHVKVAGDKSLVDLGTYLVDILCNQLPAAIWRAIAPFCPTACMTAAAPAGHVNISTSYSEFNVWVFSEEMINLNEDALRELTFDQIRSFVTLSEHFKKLPHVDPMHVINIAAKCTNAKTTSKVFAALEQEHGMPVIPSKGSYGVVWKNELEVWQGTATQRERFVDNCSLFKGQSPLVFQAMAKNIMELFLKENHGDWDEMATYLKNFAGKFYFPRMMATPVPKNPETMFVLKGSAATRLNASLQAKRELWNHHVKSSALMYFTLSAQALCDVLKESHGKRIKPASDEEVRHICTHWYTPEKIKTAEGEKLKLRLLKILAKPRGTYGKWKEFTALTMEHNYSKALGKLYAIDEKETYPITVIVQLARVLCTQNTLDEKALMEHRVPRRRKTQREIYEEREEGRKRLYQREKYMPRKKMRKIKLKQPLTDVPINYTQ